MHSRFALIGPVVLIAFGASDLGAQCAPAKANPYDVRTTAVARPSGPGIEQLQSLVRQFYPGLALQNAPAKITIGFVLDSTCKVLRHSAAFTPDSTHHRVLIRTLFPDLKESGSSGGIADAVPSEGERRLLVTWIVVQ